MTKDDDNILKKKKKNENFKNDWRIYKTKQNSIKKFIIFKLKNKKIFFIVSKIKIKLKNF